RAENRFVAAVVRRLVAMCREAASASGAAGKAPQWLDAAPGRELNDATRALAVLAAEAPWSGLAGAAMPKISFLLRDHPHYRVMRTVGEALDDSLRWSPLPGDPAALGLRTQTLNALFEVWVSQAVRAAVRRRLGLGAPLGAPLPRGGAAEAVTAPGRVQIGRASCRERVWGAEVGGRVAKNSSEREYR